MKEVLLTAIGSLLEELEASNSVVGRKLAMAISQLEKASSIEEYQQIGILIRDAWIEFGQSIFETNMLPQDTPAPGNADAKK